MRRWRTALVVVAVAALAVFAAADALRGNDEPKAPAASPTTTRPKPPTLRETLRGQGVSGQILYSDQECIIHSLVLPQMVDEVVRGENGAGAFHSCRFSVAGGRFRDDDELMSPDGQLVARCRAGHVEVFIASGGRRLSRVPGCAPAWRPDSGLTYARDGEIVLGGGVVLLSRPELRAAARRHPNLGTYEAGFDVHVTELAWLDESHLVVVMEISGRYLEPQFLAVVFRGKTITAVAANFRGPYQNLVVSPGASFVASEDGTLYSGRRCPRPASKPSDRRGSRLLSRRTVARVRHRSEHLPDRHATKQGAQADHPPARARPGPGLGGRQPSDASRWARNWMKPGPSTSTPTCAFGSLPVRFQRST